MNNNLRALIRDFGITNVGIYRYNGIIYIFFSDSHVNAKDVAACIDIPIAINGIKFNISP